MGPHKSAPTRSCKRWRSYYQGVQLSRSTVKILINLALRNGRTRSGRGRLRCDGATSDLANSTLCAPTSGASLLRMDDESRTRLYAGVQHCIRTPLSGEKKGGLLCSCPADINVRVILPSRPLPVHVGKSPWTSGSCRQKVVHGGSPNVLVSYIMNRHVAFVLRLFPRG